MRTALVTGASSGIGYEFAKLLAAEGFHLVLVARTVAPMTALAEELEAQHSIRCHVIEKDLSRPNSARQVFEEVQKKALMPNLLINNAGVGLKGEFTHLDLERQIQMMRLNMESLVELTHHFLPTMLARKEGGILNVASTAAFQPGPGMAVYYATKAFVLSFSEALHEELKEKGVHVTALCPGPTETGFAAAAEMMDSKLFKMMSKGVSARAVAQKGLRGIQYNCAVVIAGAMNKFGAFSSKMSPRSWTRKITHYLNT